MTNRKTALSVDSSVDGTRVVVDCSAFQLANDVVLERLGELLPIIDQILAADEVWHSLPDDLVSSRFRERLALDMVYQACLARAHSEAVSLLGVVSGVEPSSGASFPEFRRGSDPLADEAS